MAFEAIVRSWVKFLWNFQLIFSLISGTNNNFCGHKNISPLDYSCKINSNDINMKQIEQINLT